MAAIKETKLWNLQKHMQMSQSISQHNKVPQRLHYMTGASTLSQFAGNGK